MLLIVNSKIMARSLAAVLREKDALQRRNQELESANFIHSRFDDPRALSLGPFLCRLLRKPACFVRLICRETQTHFVR